MTAVTFTENVRISPDEKRKIPEDIRKGMEGEAE